MIRRAEEGMRFPCAAPETEKQSITAEAPGAAAPGASDIFAFREKKHYEIHGK